VFCDSSLNKVPRLVSWKHPLENVIKLNVDGSSIGNTSLYGYGGLLKNSSGVKFLVFSKSCNFTSNINVELQTTSHGLHLA